MKAPLILVAGGESSRMGQPKGLLDYHGEPWLEAQLNRFRAAGGGQAVVVLGYQAADYFKRLPWLQPAFTGFQEVRGVQVVPALNEVPKHGPFSSILTGLKALKDRRDGAYVLPVDVPIPGRGVFETLEAERARTSTMGAGASVPIEVQIPVHGGRGGHPVWLSESFIARLLSAPRTGRLARLDRRIAQLPAASIQRVEVADPAVLVNFNTPEQYQAYLDGTPRLQ